jgi:hypothetical protein
MNPKVGNFDFVAECDRLEKINAEMLEALKQAERLIDKQQSRTCDHFEGEQLGCPICNALEAARAAIRKAEEGA